MDLDHREYWAQDVETGEKRGPFESHAEATRGGFKAFPDAVFWTGYGADEEYFDLRWHRPPHEDFDDDDDDDDK